MYTDTVHTVNPFVDLEYTSVYISVVTIDYTAIKALFPECLRFIKINTANIVSLSLYSFNSTFRNIYINMITFHGKMGINNDSL